MKSFRIGGIHPPGNKISKDAPITTVPLPDSVTLPLSQHIGAPAEPCVGKGDYVKAGQLIGQAAGFVSANVHSPVSGQVTAVDSVPDAGGIRRIAVTIRREGDEWADGIDCGDTLIKECYLTDEEIIARITAAGIVGMGGATFPTQVKLSVPARQTGRIPDRKRSRVRTLPDGRLPYNAGTGSRSVGRHRYFMQSARGNESVHRYRK